MLVRVLTFSLALATAFALGTGASRAQIAPDDAGSGTKLGMQELNNSGQVGSVTLFTRGQNTLVVIDLVEQARGRTEPAHIHRGATCDSIDPKPTFGLAPVVNGQSKTLVHVSEARLLSGNYSVNVHSSAQHIGRYVSCGHLYR